MPDGAYPDVGASLDAVAMDGQDPAGPPLDGAADGVNAAVGSPAGDGVCPAVGSSAADGV